MKASLSRFHLQYSDMKTCYERFHLQRWKRGSMRFHLWEIKNLKYTFSPMLEIKTHITSFYLWRSKCIICVLISRRSKPCSHVFISGDKNIHFIVSTLRDENVFVHKPQGRWKLISKVFNSVGDEDLIIKSLTLIEIKTCYMSFHLHW